MQKGESEEEKNNNIYIISPGSYHRGPGRLLRFPSQLTRRLCIKKQLFNFNGHYFDIHLAIKPKIFSVLQDWYIILLMHKKRRGAHFLKIFFLNNNTCIYFHSVRCRECQKFALDRKFRRKHFYPPAEQKNYIPACLRPMGNISAHLEPIHRWWRRAAFVSVFFPVI